MDGRKEGRKEEGECSGEEEGRGGLVEQLLPGWADVVKERDLLSWQEVTPKSSSEMTPIRHGGQTQRNKQAMRGGSNCGQPSVAPQKCLLMFTFWVLLIQSSQIPHFSASSDITEVCRQKCQLPCKEWWFKTKLTVFYHWEAFKGIFLIPNDHIVYIIFCCPFHILFWIYFICFIHYAYTPILSSTCVWWH